MNLNYEHWNISKPVNNGKFTAFEKTIFCRLMIRHKACISHIIWGFYVLSNLSYKIDSNSNFSCIQVVIKAF